LHYVGQFEIFDVLGLPVRANAIHAELIWSATLCEPGAAAMVGALRSASDGETGNDQDLKSPRYQGSYPGQWVVRRYNRTFIPTQIKQFDAV
jgi:hypothetical protein